MFAVHEQVNPYVFVPLFVSAGYNQLVDDAPRYGVDSGAFGQQLGAAAIRQASMRFIADGFMPVLLHEDPRYYRKATGSYVSRGVYAGERALIARHDSGKNGFNFAGVSGRLFASVLTLAYYPDRSANAGVVFSTWATSIAGDAGNNLFREFLPDALHAWHRHRSRHSADAGSERK